MVHLYIVTILKVLLSNPALKLRTCLRKKPKPTPKVLPDHAGGKNQEFVAFK